MCLVGYNQIISLNLTAACTVCNVLHGWSREQRNEQQNNVPNPKNNATTGYKGPVKNEAFESCRSSLDLSTFCLLLIILPCFISPGHYVLGCGQFPYAQEEETISNR